MLGRGKLVAFWGLDESGNPLINREHLNRYFRQLGLDIEASCDLGLQLEYFVTNPDFIPLSELRQDLMKVQSPSTQAACLRTALK